MKYQKEKIKKWQGLRNTDTGEIEGGYLWFYTNEEKTESIGKRIYKAKNRSEAIKEYYS
jgi:hypothetical protein